MPKGKSALIKSFLDDFAQCNKHLDINGRSLKSESYYSLELLSELFPAQVSPILLKSCLR